MKQKQSFFEKKDQKTFAPRKIMVGVVLLVQESRFQLRDDLGVAHLFTLSANAAAEPAQLTALALEQALVEVRYSPSRNMIGNTASAIARLT